MTGSFKRLMSTEFNIFGPTCHVLRTLALVSYPHRAESSLIFIITHTLLLLFLSAKNKHNAALYCTLISDGDKHYYSRKQFLSVFFFAAVLKSFLCHIYYVCKKKKIPFLTAGKLLSRKSCTAESKQNKMWGDGKNL